MPVIQHFPICEMQPAGTVRPIFCAAYSLQWPEMTSKTDKKLLEIFCERDSSSKKPERTA